MSHSSLASEFFSKNSLILMLQPHDSPPPTTLPLLKLESEKQVEMSSQNTYADSHEIGISGSSKDIREAKGSGANRKAKPEDRGSGAKG
jgi:hypothetical protein